MATLRFKTISLRDAVHGDVDVTIDATNGNTIVLEQGGDTIWVENEDIPVMIDVLRKALEIAAS